MILICARNRFEIVQDAMPADSFLERLLGLINPHNSRSLIFNTRFGIHTFFLFVDIDVLVLDKFNQIKVAKENLKPFSFFFYNPRFSKIIELPKGTIKNSRLLLGDKILFV